MYITYGKSVWGDPEQFNILHIFIIFFLNDNYLLTNDYQSISSSHSTTKLLLYIYKKFDFFKFLQFTKTIWWL